VKKFANPEFLFCSYHLPISPSATDSEKMCSALHTGTVG
jgi:hypothetical protein